MPHPLRSKSEVEIRSDKIIDYFLPGYFLAGLIFAVFYSTWGIAVGVGGLALLAYYGTRFLLPESDLYQYTLSAILGLFMAQYIYQMHGLFEMHFFAFIGSAILITYQNWKLQIPILIVVGVHHAVFGYLQDNGFDKVYFTELSYFTFQTFVIHILLSAVIFFTSGLWAYQLKKYDRLKEAQRDQLQRHVAVLDKAVAQGKFEIASDVMHDIGNAVVGFGTYLTRVKRLQDEQSPQVLHNLAHFFTEHKGAVASAIGEEKAGAVVKVLTGVADTQSNHREELSQVISRQMDIIANIQQILHIQRQYIEGHETRDRKPVQLRNIINDALALLFVPIDEQAISVDVAIPEDIPPISGDRTKLIQLLINVLKYSIDSMSAQEKGKNIFLRVRGKDSMVLLEVRDTGMGFDRDGAPRPGPADAQGIKAIIDSHGGVMAMTSEGLTKGTTTTIQFSV